MNRYLDDRPTVAYAVPFRIDRSGAPRYELANIGSEPLRAITLTLLGSGLMPSAAPRRLLPGQSMSFTVRSDNPARNTIVVVRWFRPSGEQYLWRVSF